MSPMSAVLGFLLLLLLLPLIAIAAGIALYLLALACAIACPFCYFLLATPPKSITGRSCGSA
jgi:hypothetical protein